MNQLTMRCAVQSAESAASFAGVNEPRMDLRIRRLEDQNIVKDVEKVKKVEDESLSVAEKINASSYSSSARIGAKKEASLTGLGKLSNRTEGLLTARKRKEKSQKERMEQLERDAAQEAEAVKAKRAAEERCTVEERGIIMGSARLRGSPHDFLIC